MLLQITLLSNAFHCECLRRYSCNLIKIRDHVSTLLTKTKEKEFEIQSNCCIYNRRNYKTINFELIQMLNCIGAMKLLQSN